MTHVATRLAAVKPSALMAASMAAKALRAQSFDVGPGEPDFPTPLHVAAAAYGLSRFFRFLTATVDSVLTTALARAVSEAK